MTKEMVPYHVIENKIYFFRGKKVMLDKDLAELYGIETKYLKRAVKRNKKRFPGDFMFILSNKEIEAMGCQIGTPVKAHFGGYNPFVFTEHGILMLSSVLNSEKAIQVNIQIMRTFNKIKEMLASHKELRQKIEELEKRYDGQFKVVFEAIKQLMSPPQSKSKQIGFRKD